MTTPCPTCDHYRQADARAFQAAAEHAAAVLRASRKPPVVRVVASECICPYTPPETWLSAASCGYGGGYEPGSMQEWDPACPVHPGDPYYAAPPTQDPPASGDESEGL